MDRLNPSHAFVACLVLVVSGLIDSASAAACGKWYSEECLCETDPRYCNDPALDDILGQHGIWASLQGLYTYEATVYGVGGTTADPYSPHYGYFNHTIVGSRDYQHRYVMLAPVNASICKSILPYAAEEISGLLVLFLTISCATINIICR